MRIPVVETSRILVVGGERVELRVLLGALVENARRERG